MAVSNTVEAALVSRYVDGITKGLESTTRSLQSHLNTVATASRNFTATLDSALEATARKLEGFSADLRRRASESDSFWKQLGFGAAGAVIAIAGALGLAGKAIASWLIELAKESSEITELKLAYEGLAQAAGWQADTLSRLKKETEGLVSTIELARNANRVMQSGVKVSSDMYVELAGNVFKLAKSAHVDGAQALNTLTDALVKGNARGLQAIGIHLNVKDAITEAAAAQGAQANRLQDAAKMQAFYNEVLEQTRIAVAKLPADFVSIDDAITRAEKSWRGLFLAVGEGINRSAVFQQLLQKVAGWMDTVGAKKSTIESISLATNRAIIDMIRFGATLLELGGWAATAIDTVWGAANAVINLLGGLITFTFTGIRAVITGVLEVFAAIPGPQQKLFKGLAEDSRQMLDYWQTATNEFAKGFAQSFDQVGRSQARMDAIAGAARSLAAELEKVAGQSVHAASGVAQVGAAGGQGGVDIEKLKKQLEAFRDLQRELNKGFSPTLAVYDDYFRKLKIINAAVLADDKEKAAARLDLAYQTAKKLMEIWQKAYDESIVKFEEQVRKMQTTQSPAGLSVPSSIPGPKTPNDHTNIDLQRQEDLKKAEEWARIMEALRRSNDRNAPKYYQDLRRALEGLNEISLNPFRAMMQQFRDDIVAIGQDVTTAWSQFMADLVSNQENAGKKFLAALIQVFAKELLVLAIRHTYLAISHAAALDFAGAARHAAAAAALGAGAGILTGLASNLAQTNKPGAQGDSFQSNVPRPTSSQQVQVIQVGAAGRAQTSGEASQAAKQQPAEVHVKLALDTKGVLQVVKQNVRGNGQLRVLLQRA